jgi:transposase-like protein
MEFYGPALARGRRTSQARRIETEMHRQVRELVRMDANQSAIARVLGVREETVSHWLA